MTQEYREGKYTFLCNENNELQRLRRRECSSICDIQNI